MRFLTVFSGIALLCASAMAQDVVIPEQAMIDYDTMSDQWTDQNAEWNLYDVVAVGGTSNNGRFWPEADLIDLGKNGNQWVLGTLDQNENGIPDTYEFALATAVRHATIGDGGALRFPEFEAQWQENDRSVGRENADGDMTWLSAAATEPGDDANRSWTSQRRWYTTLTTYAQSFEDFFEGGAGTASSFFGHATDNNAGTDGGECCGGGGAGPYLAWPQEPFSTTLGEADGDLDGDGLTNLQEYLDNASGTVWEFALAAISGSPPTEQNASVSYRAVAGDSNCYNVTNAGTAGSGDFTWTFDDGQGGGPVALEGELDGQLCFEPLTEADAGTYVVSFDDGDEAVKVPNTFILVLEVLPEGTPVPASTNWTLLITILAIALCAGAFFGRKAIRQ